MIANFFVALMGFMYFCSYNGVLFPLFMSSYSGGNLETEDGRGDGFFTSGPRPKERHAVIADELPLVDDGLPLNREIYTDDMPLGKYDSDEETLASGDPSSTTKRDMPITMRRLAVSGVGTNLSFLSQRFSNDAGATKMVRTNATSLAELKADLKERLELNSTVQFHPSFLCVYSLRRMNLI